ncbi:hypothetical protein KJ973_02425 [Patescibacteria group bacterium]|nr:hypothetical protein [Patescibacteria group bacterium]MBU1246424.1 hypothetical protein [Patescibacteria group bacterium]MBU1519520.1 hypothetical protein [Patescibacteria group bacterium]MBU1730022.1 hypothetical protein [Patescibacteria group bacterium]MBU2010091.1 hypothetical protein [Patescibacteria group bacterium]
MGIAVETNWVTGLMAVKNNKNSKTTHHKKDFFSFLPRVTLGNSLNGVLWVF